jgi:hypothetical protein
MAEIEITLDDLVARLQRAAGRMDRGRTNRLLLLNTAAALRALGARLEATLAENIELRAERGRMVAQGGEHRVN